MSGLAAKLLSVHDTLDRHGIPHAFGGAIALAYCTGEPRATIDLDINVFVDASEAWDVLSSLPPEVRRDERIVRRAVRDGQVRVWWDDVPLDLFFSYHPFHDHAASRVRTVPFEGMRIPVLDCTDLVVFKALFGRTKDWADIEATAGVADHADAERWIAELVGEESDTLYRLRLALREIPDEQPRPRGLGKPRNQA